MRDFEFGILHVSEIIFRHLLRILRTYRQFRTRQSLLKFRVCTSSRENLIAATNHFLNHNKLSMKRTNLLFDFLIDIHYMHEILTYANF